MAQALGSGIRTGQAPWVVEQAAATLGLSACSSAVKESVGQLVSVTPENNEKIASGVDRSERRGCSQGAGLVYIGSHLIREGERAIRRLQ